MRFSLVSFVILAAIAVPAVAQAPPQSVTNMESFRGRIMDADLGLPVTEAVTIVVTKEGASDATRRVIDVKGEFVVPDLSLGRYRMQFRYKGIETGTARYVQVTALPAITPADIYLRLPGEITGAVVDKDREPVQGSKVMLVSVEYRAGQSLYTVFAGGRPTDDRGTFSISARVEAGLPYFLLALPPETNKPTLSGTPTLEAMWYPGRPGVAQPFVIRSDERKRVDFVMEKKETHCVDGVLTKNGQPDPNGLNFIIAIPEVAKSTQGVIARGQSDAAGHFQVCGLWPGEFLLDAGMSKESYDIPQRIVASGSDALYGRATLSIADRDVHDVMLNAQSSVTLNAEIRLDSGQTPEQKYGLNFIPLSRVAFESQPFLSPYKDVVVPSQFMISLLPSTDYVVGLRIPDGTPDAYLKDVTCGGTILRSILQLRDADCGLRITLGTDMGKLAARIVDKDNNKDLNSLVCVSSTSAVTPEEIAEMGSCSSTEPGTTSVSIALRPDRYQAVVMPPTTADWVEYFLTNRSQGTLIDIKPRSTTQVTLKSNKGR